MPDHGRWTPNGGDPSLDDVNRVDRFLDALGSNETAYSTDHAEAELAFLFADWRDEVRGAPVTAQVTTRDAIDALDVGLGSRKRSRSSLALVGSAAAAVLCIGGFGAGVYAAGPGDALYGIRSSMFGDEQATRDDAVVLAAQTEMQQVQKLIDDGQWDQAQDKLVALSTTVQSVETPQQKQQLVDQYNQLTVKVVEQDPAASLPPDAPLPTFTDSPLTLLPVPTFQIGDTTTSSSTETTTSTSTDTTSTTTSAETTPPSDTSSPTDTTTPSTPGPEILLTPPPSSPATTPPSSAPSSPAPSPTTTTTRVEVTSVTTAPSVPPSSPVAPAPSSRPEPRSEPSSTVVPPRQSQATETAEEPAPVEESTSATTAPKPPRGEEPAPVTTTVAPPS